MAEHIGRKNYIEGSICEFAKTAGDELNKVGIPDALHTVARVRQHIRGDIRTSPGFAEGSQFPADTPHAAADFENLILPRNAQQRNEIIQASFDGATNIGFVTLTTRRIAGKFAGTR